MKHLSVVLCLFVFIFTEINGQTKAQKLLEEAQALYENEKAGPALKKVEQALAIEPSAKAHLLKANICVLKTDLNCFFTEVKQALSLDAEDYEIYFRRAYIYYLMQKTDYALTDMQTAIKVASIPEHNVPDSVVTLLKREYYSYHFQSGEYEKAYDGFVKLAKENPNDLAILNNLGIALSELDSIERVIEVYEQIRDIDSTFLTVYTNLGFFNSELGNYQEAWDYYLVAEKQGNVSTNLYNNMGYVKHKLGENKVALNYINKALKLDPTNAYAYRNLALVHLENEKFDDACDALSEALRFGYTKMYGNDVANLYKKHCY